MEIHRYASKSELYVSTQLLPTANFSSNVTSGHAPLSIQFIDLSKNAASRNWNFGDGTYSTQQNPMHTYSAVGNYTVALTVSNTAGSNTVTKSTYIRVTTAPQKLIASFSSNATTGYAPLNVAFTDTSTGTSASWLWSFGDGVNSIQKNPAHTYSIAGNYTVALTVNNTSGNNTVTKSTYIKVKSF